ncbi:nucleotidyl transferase AbiEii/AbiGii toxin family protein [Petrocella sp. FN5]|uniref:nucleotidyl transferase AbiEii/AbiGii toxin family protein n=1 Tax=Petrocella sp. FN5 TaxID=3032002 RepID=UPI0023DC9087|nr:nucleotidyl transferase AbiEii/AbiGii toxin family protein [Petrocella sp. FN5]MDF1618685.1 nucleotidyl transferase AbiEii/AbiGii toxin family protein [Petrocella sp. FN5]
MNLHLDKIMFDDIVTEVSEGLNIHRSIIIKDYFVTLILLTLKEFYPEFIFKGGTSLSKCYDAINRFSEDIDLSYHVTGDENITQRRIKSANKGIKEAINALGFDHENEEDFKSGRKFQRFDIGFGFYEDTSLVRDHIIIENSVLTISFPVVELCIESLIGKYLNDYGKEAISELYGLYSFGVLVQDIRRTFIDKIYAICDYYLEDKAEEHSRHIYDVHMLYSKIGDLENLKELIPQVRKEREGNIKSLSIIGNHKIKDILDRIIQEDFYKRDYRIITKNLLYDNTSYEEAINTLKKISLINIF